jgi:hypothetical protein
MKFLFGLLLSSLCVFAAEKEATAFELMKEGNRYVGEQAKDKVVQVRSEKSYGSLSPKVWYVVYYDPTASMKAVEVKFAAGKMIDVKRPFRLIELARDNEKTFDKSKLKIDSDEAIQLAIKEPILEDVKVKSVEAKLENHNALGPVWRLKLWAEKLVKSNETAHLGTMTISAEDGKMVTSDIKLSRLD